MKTVLDKSKLTHKLFTVGDMLITCNSWAKYEKPADQIWFTFLTPNQIAHLEKGDEVWLEDVVTPFGKASGRKLVQIESVEMHDSIYLVTYNKDQHFYTGTKTQGEELAVLIDEQQVFTWTKQVHHACMVH